MTKNYRSSDREMNLRSGELIEIDAGRGGRFVGYFSYLTQSSITLQPSMPGKETKTDYDNPFTFWYANFEDPFIKITRLADMDGLEKVILLNCKEHHKDRYQG